MAGGERTQLSSVSTGLVPGDASYGVPHFQKMAALGELASGIVHDFRNILQTASALLETIGERSNDPREVRRLIASALMAVDRGKSVTERLANFSRTRIEFNATDLPAFLLRECNGNVHGDGR